MQHTSIMREPLMFRIYNRATGRLRVMENQLRAHAGAAKCMWLRREGEGAPLPNLFPMFPLPSPILASSFCCWFLGNPFSSFFLRNPAEKQTNRRQCKHNLLGGGN